MKSTHGHEVLHMMKGNDYSDESLLVAINQKFGIDAKFHTCSKHNMTANELIAFLKSKGKFKTTEQTAYTVDSQKICDPSS